MTQAQANLLKRYTSQIVLTYDSDGAGIKAALRAIPILKEAGMTVKVLNMKPYKDPDEFIKNLGADAYRERIEQASGSFLFEISQLYGEYDMNDPESKTKFHRAVASRLCTFTAELERKNYMEAVCDVYHIPYDSMGQLVKEEARRTSLTGLTREERPEKRERRQEKEDGIQISQKLLLTWLIEAPQLYHKIKNLLSPEDFTEDLYRRVAEMVWDQLETGLVNPAGIVNHFINDEEEYKTVAGLFNTRLRGTMTREEQEKAFTETVYRVKKNSLDQKSRSASDMSVLQELIKEQAALNALHITFD
jgi:DNA primase